MGMQTESQRKGGRVSLLVPVAVIFCLMVVMVLYTSRALQSVAVNNIQEVGEDRISGAAAHLENYMETTKSVLWITADTVDHMVRNGASNPEIQDYIIEESKKQEQHFDENYTGIYGYVRGEYLDGVGWTPPAGYDPTTRDWYQAALAGKGESVIVSPYVDAQTGAVIISISRMLSNGSDVLSMDVTMNHIQDVVSELQVKGKGYGFIVNADGMLIAHHDEAQRGRYFNESEAERAFLEKLLATRDGSFVIDMDGQQSTVFVHPIMDQWRLIIVVGNSELYAEVWRQTAINVAICAVIFVLIAFFYLLGRRREQNYSRRIEEMRVEEQRQAFEARALKLEKEAADQANKAKSDFLADMSHEIRTPINAVLGMNEMILRESQHAQHAGHIDDASLQEVFSHISADAMNIESAGSNLLAIINDILDFSKIESGKMTLVEAEYQISSVLNDVSNMIFFKAKDKGLEFIIDVDEALPDRLYGDEVRVRQILTNVLNNAVKYTERGSVRLALRGEPQADLAPGHTLKLIAEVADTGIGIRREDRDKLFAKFQRLDLKHNSTVEGTGLGLAITQSLLKMMGGSIGVESEYGHGSIFMVTIPQLIVSMEPVGDFKKRFRLNVQEAQAYQVTFHAPEARVLIVDDTKMNLTVAAGLLRSTLLQIDTAGGGEEALELTQATPYDLILMDQRMPRMDGIEALRRLRVQKDGRNRNTPVICLTADAVIGARERYRDAGFTDYLTKPIDSVALEQMLLKYLPKEKVIIVSEEPTGEPTVRTDEEMGEDFAPLRRAGIDPTVGLGYCQNDSELYRTVLEEYAHSAEKRLQVLEASFQAQDCNRYGIQVHALKSASKMIGAKELSEIAARMEEAANAEDRTAIEGEHSSMILLYEAVVAAIRQECLSMEKSPSDDEEILEFIPAGESEN